MKKGVKRMSCLLLYLTIIYTLQHTSKNKSLLSYDHPTATAVLRSTTIQQYLIAVSTSVLIKKIVLCLSRIYGIFPGSDTTPANTALPTCT